MGLWECLKCGCRAIADGLGICPNCGEAPIAAGPAPVPATAVADAQVPTVSTDDDGGEEA